MKYLVVSDSHGDRDILVDLAKRYTDKVDHLFHCGDSELTADDPIWQNFSVVKGNCDFEPFPESLLVETDADRVYLTHGHLVGIKSSLQTLIYKALEQEATIALFGHSHELGVMMEQGILLLNPGSILLPRGAYLEPTYAIIDSQPDQYTVEYYNRAHQLQPDLTRTFSK